MTKLNEYLSIIQYLKLNDATNTLISLDQIITSNISPDEKQTQVENLIEELENKITDFQVLTPSGKAANVIKKKIKDGKSDFQIIYNYFQEAKEEFLDSGDLPQRICKNAKAKRACECSMKSACFNLKKCKRIDQ